MENLFERLEGMVNDFAKLVTQGEQAEDLKAFIDVLFPTLEKGELIELRLFPVHNKEEGQKNRTLEPIQFFYSRKDAIIEALPALIQKQIDGSYGVYFGVCPRITTKGNRESVSRVHALWADLDAKEYKGRKNGAWAKLDEFKLKPTLIVDSGHGYHAYWKLKEPQTDFELVESYLKSIADELGSDPAVGDIPRVMRLPNTINNKKENKPEIACIVSINKNAVYELSDFEYVLKGKQALQTEVIYEKKEDDWIAISLKGLKEGSRNTEFAKIIGRMINDNYAPEEAFAMLQPHAEKCGFPIEELKNEIDGMYRRYQKEKVSKDKENKKYIAYFDGLVDIVEHEGRPAFLIKDKGELLITTEWTIGDNQLFPPPKEAIPWLLPRACEVLRYYANDNNKQLYQDLLNYHKDISELPNDDYYDLLVIWDFHTYLLENFKHTPYLYFFAVAERGKSRTGQGIAYVAFRGFWTESINDNQIIRLASDCKATIFIDIMNLWKEAEGRLIKDILLSRYEKGSKVPRVLYPEKGPFLDTIYYDVFGPTIIATNIKVHEILETRAIEINMPETDKTFGNDVEANLALPLKERLVAFRARHLNNELPYIAKPTKGRLGDILKPLSQVIRFVNPEREANFKRLADAIEAGRKLELSTSWEAELTKVIIDLESKVDKGLLLTAEIVNYVNREKDERFKVTSNRVGRDVVALGFEKRHASSGNMAIVYDKEKINRLAAKYGVNKTSVTSESSDNSPGSSSVADISDVSEDL